VTSLLAKTSLLTLLGYAIASVNVALVLTRLGAIPDPRQAYSGNPGVSNVYRVAGLPWAALVLLLDVSRAAGLALLAIWWLPRCLSPIAAVGLVAGNRWPLIHGFRGGKGVANMLGFTALLAPWASAAAAAAWVVLFALVRRSFLASFGMVAILAAGLLLRCGLCVTSAAGVTILLVMILGAHRSNVKAWLSSRDLRPPSPSKEDPREPG